MPKTKCAIVIEADLSAEDGPVGSDAVSVGLRQHVVVERVRQELRTDIRMTKMPATRAVNMEPGPIVAFPVSSIRGRGGQNRDDCNTGS
jgi:hypothetical protein